MSPIVNGKWYATMAEGYADSPFFRGEVKGCVHDPTRIAEGRACAECERILAAMEVEDRAHRDAVAAYEALPWWRRFLAVRPTRSGWPS